MPFIPERVGRGAHYAYVMPLYNVQPTFHHLCYKSHLIGGPTPNSLPDPGIEPETPLVQQSYLRPLDRRGSPFTTSTYRSIKTKSRLIPETPMCGSHKALFHANPPKTLYDSHLPSHRANREVIIPMYRQRQLTTHLQGKQTCCY
ncbi:hypothetical protein SFRURICE_015409, partial [Spodoptera frugiperda]